ncbi:MAG: MFS transporter [Rhodoluna sp.]
MKKSKAFWVMLAGTLAYLLAVTNRSSMGVAALAATDRFEVNAAALSTLAVSQLAVYAVMQIPVGILLDRFGPKRLLLFGSIAMGFGQIVVGIATQLSIAVVGRMFVGLGDAFIFISLIRLVSGWYTGAPATRIQQLLTNFGQLGQAVSAIPFAALLSITGWQFAFMTLGSISLLVVFVGLILIQDERVHEPEHARADNLKKVIGYLIDNVRNPGVRMAFWVHFTLQSAPSFFSLLWGYPFLVSAQGLSPALASGVLSSFVVIGFFVGPVVSWYCAKYPRRRSNLVLGMIFLLATFWSLVIFIPGTTPFAILILLAIVLASSGSTSMIAFDYVRTFVPKNRMGTASGFVNVGGFLATFSMMFIAGVILDLVQEIRIKSGEGAAPLYSAMGFKWAMSVQLVALVLGAALFLFERSKARLKMFEDEGIKMRPTRVVIGERLRRKTR